MMESSYISENIDEETLFYMNAHLQDIEKFKERNPIAVVRQATVIAGP